MADSDIQVTHIDSNKFGTAIDAFTKGIKEYEDIISGVKDTTQTLSNNWKGKGYTQFQKDYITIFRQLEDISEVMYDLRDALVECQAAYITTDDQVAKMASEVQ